jgi:zinc protease
LDEYNKKVESVTAEQIKDAFNRRLKHENFVTIIVGDPNAN